MTDFWSTLLGGSTQSSTSVSTPSNFNPFTNMLTPYIMGAVGSGAPQYNGPMSAPMTGQEGTILGNLPNSGSGSATTNYLNDVLSGRYMPGGDKGNPFIDSMIKGANQPLLNGLQDTLSTTLPGQFTAAGQNTGPQGSSAFDRAAALETTRVGQEMSNNATQIENNAYNTATQQRQQAVPLAQQEVQTTINSLQAAALPRLIQQMGIQNGLQAFQANASTLMQFLSTIGGLARPDIANTSVSSSEGSSSKGIIPDAVSIASLF